MANVTCTRCGASVPTQHATTEACAKYATNMIGAANARIDKLLVVGLVESGARQTIEEAETLVATDGRENAETILTNRYPHTL
jgi:hypothetical protein